MDPQKLLYEIMETYWDALVGYLISKRGDSEWVCSNQGWLEKLVDSGNSTVSGIGDGNGLIDFYRVAEENDELKSVLYEACNLVIDRYREQVSCAA
jgi:hypothetical protein